MDLALTRPKARRRLRQRIAAPGHHADDRRATGSRARFFCSPAPGYRPRRRTARARSRRRHRPPAPPGTATRRVRRCDGGCVDARGLSNKLRRGQLGAVGVYLLGAPAVHAAHGRTLAVVGSVGLRIGVPVLVSALAAATADCSRPVAKDDNCTFGPSIVGLGVGIILAAIIVSAAIAWDRPSPAAPDRPAPERGAVVDSPARAVSGSSPGRSGPRVRWFVLTSRSTFSSFSRAREIASLLRACR